jgi:hypothetical protein
MIKKTETGSADIIAVTATPPNKKPVTLGYDSSTPTKFIVEDSTSFSGMNVEQVYLEDLTETIERSKGLLDGGGKISLTVPNWAGGGGFKFERLPKSTVKKTKKIIYRSLVRAKNKPKK